MFPHIPLRPKPDCYDRYDMTRNGRPSSIRASSSDYFSPPYRSEDPLERLLGGISPLSSDRFRDRDSLYARRTLPLDIRCSSIPRSNYDDNCIPFEQAAAELYSALQHADKEFQTLQKAFNSQISGMSLWLPPHYADLLWSIYTEWDGVPVDQQNARIPRLVSSSSNVATFNHIAKRITKAADAVRQSAPRTDRLGFLGSNSFPKADFGDWSYDTVKTTTRKLQISLDAIDELIGIVRQQRQRMTSLVREIVAAKQLLESMREVWDVPRRKTTNESGSSGYRSDWTSGEDI